MDIFVIKLDNLDTFLYKIKNKILQSFLLMRILHIKVSETVWSLHKSKLSSQSLEKIRTKNWHEKISHIYSPFTTEIPLSQAYLDKIEPSPSGSPTLLQIIRSLEDSGN